MVRIQIHVEVFEDLKTCKKRKWYVTLGKEMPRVCRLLMEDSRMPGESPVHHIKLLAIQNKAFHAGINLPEENVNKKKGARVVYVRENLELIKILYLGGHKDRRYDNPHYQVDMIQKRYSEGGYRDYIDNLIFDEPTF